MCVCVCVCVCMCMYVCVYLCVLRQICKRLLSWPSNGCQMLYSITFNVYLERRDFVGNTDYNNFLP